MRRHFGPTLTTLALTVLSRVAVVTGPAARAQARLPYGPIPVDCDRACLEGLVDQYLGAVVAHDPKRLPLSADVRYAENDQMMPVGDGFWGTATAAGGYRQIVADPVSGQVGFLGSMREGNNPLLFTLRLKVQLGGGQRLLRGRAGQRRQGLLPVVGSSSMMP